MFRYVTTGLTVGAALALGAGPALAANPHFIGDPTLVNDGTTLTSEGSVAGLGNEDIDVTLDAEGIAQVTCTNPGGNVAPGQDTEVDVSGTVTDIETKNGRAFFSVTTDEPTVGSEVCPNGKWTANVESVEFTDAVLTVVQDGEVVLTEDLL